MPIIFSLGIACLIVLKTHVKNTVQQTNYSGKYRILVGVTVLVLVFFFFKSRMLISSADLLIRNCIEFPAYFLVMFGVAKILFKRNK